MFDFYLDENLVKYIVEQWIFFDLWDFGRTWSKTKLKAGFTLLQNLNLGAK